MATTIITLNQILDLCRAFVTAHPNLDDFGYGPTSDIGTSRTMRFPYMWASHQSDSYIRIANKTSIPELKIMFFFMDKVNDSKNIRNVNGEDSNNGQEIMSDCLQYVQDFTNEVLSNWGQYGVMISEDVRIFPGFDETTDKVNGWVAEFTFKIKYINAVC